MRAFFAVFASAITLSVAQQAFQGSVTFTLPPVLGACGRVCDATFTCHNTVGPDKQCGTADAAVHKSIFFSNFNASDPNTADAPMCSASISSIGPLSTIGGRVCTYCEEPACGPNDLLLSDPADAPSDGRVGTWILIPGA